MYRSSIAGSRGRTSSPPTALELSSAAPPVTKAFDMSPSDPAVF